MQNDRGRSSVQTSDTFARAMVPARETLAIIFAHPRNWLMMIDIPDDRHVSTRPPPIIHPVYNDILYVRMHSSMIAGRVTQNALTHALMNMNMSHVLRRI